MKFFEWLFNVIGIKKTNNKLLGDGSDSQYVDPEIKQIDRTKEIISDSQNFIAKIHELKKLSENTQYKDKFDKILELTNKIHDKIVQDDKIPIMKLQQFHIYYSEQFITTFDEAIDELRPKKEIDKKLKGNFKVNEETNKDDVNGTWVDGIWNNDIDIKKYSIFEKTQILLKKDNLILYQGDGFYDRYEDDYGQITYSDKYSEYLVNNWNLPKTYKFIGELKTEEIPIMYDINTLKVYKILYDTTSPILLGDISDDTIKNILNSNQRIYPKAIYYNNIRSIK